MTRLRITPGPLACLLQISRRNLAPAIIRDRSRGDLRGQAVQVVFIHRRHLDLSAMLSLKRCPQLWREPSPVGEVGPAVVAAPCADHAGLYPVRRAPLISHARSLMVPIRRGLCYGLWMTSTT